jgi:SAM-dependent methyltransferase
MLAPLCDELLAVDVDEWAVAIAKENLACFPHVVVDKRTLPEETPEGPFDLIVALEVLYYWPKDVLLVALRHFEEVLAPDGVLLVGHGRVPSRRRKIVEKIRPLFLRRWIFNIKSGAPLADEIHELLLEHTRLTNTGRLVEPRYRLDFFENK